MVGVTWSECVAESAAGRTVRTPSTAPGSPFRTGIVPAVIGRPFSAPGEVHALLERRIRGHRMGRAAVEMGVWGAGGRRDGGCRSLALLVGGVSAARGALRRPCLGQFVENGCGARDAAEPRSARRASPRPRRPTATARIRIKIGPGHDVAYVDAVRRAIGPTISVTADANCSYSLDLPEHEARPRGARPARPRHDRAAAGARRPWSSTPSSSAGLSTPICLDEERDRRVSRGGDARTTQRSRGEPEARTRRRLPARSPRDPTTTVRVLASPCCAVGCSRAGSARAYKRGARVGCPTSPSRAICRRAAGTGLAT